MELAKETKVTPQKFPKRKPPKRVIIVAAGMEVAVIMI